MCKNRLRNRRGTAEIVGTTLFLVILIFFFTNVFLWYDNASRQTQTVMADKINSRVSLETAEGEGYPLKVRALGGKDIQLIRIWIEDVASMNHLFIDVTDHSVYINPGSEIYIIFGTYTSFDALLHELIIDYTPIGEVRVKVLTDLGNIASCNYQAP